MKEAHKLFRGFNNWITFTRIDRGEDAKGLCQYLDEDSRIRIENVLQVAKIVPSEPDKDKFMSTNGEEV